MTDDVKWLSQLGPALKTHIVRIVAVATDFAHGEISDAETSPRFALSAMVHAVAIMLRASMMGGDAVSVAEVAAGVEWTVSTRGAFSVPVEKQRRRVTITVDRHRYEATVVLESPTRT